MRFILWILILLVAACDADSLSNSIKEVYVNPLEDVEYSLRFTCIHEALPTPPDDADVLFKYARWLQENNQLKQEGSIYFQVERLYRIASEHDHFKANINLQNGAISGQFELGDQERLRLSQRLIGNNIATGYYLVGMYLEKGVAGLKEDSDMAMRYFRKAADEGSGQAQSDIGELLAPVVPEVSRQMRRCAAEQGQGKAAVMLSMYHRDDSEYGEALKLLQLGVAAGNESAAGRLREAFRARNEIHEMLYLGQQEDLERVERYEKIWRILARYSYANPVVPEINEIVPLPPAELPVWDGKLQWLEARLANIPPEKPSEALITQLAHARKLDPATGKPLPGSPAFSQANFPLRICYTGDACPQSGYWKVIWSSVPAVQKVVIQHFDQGDIFPLQAVERYHIRPWPLSDKTSHRDEVVEWGLLG